MKVLVVGAGPAGLYLAYALKRHVPECTVDVVEQNPPESTFGFGVVFSAGALEFLRRDDPTTCELVTPAMETWTDLTIVHRGERIAIDGIGFAAIGRLALLRLLRSQLASVGVSPQYERSLSARADLEGYDLVVGADGINSVVRRTFETSFGTTTSQLGNRFVWYGTTKTFPTLTQTFRTTPDGSFNAHHYRYSSEMSTFLVECDPATWARAGFATMGDQATRSYCENVFAEALDGHPLVTNKSVWRSFPKIKNARWSARISDSSSAVLIGDALHTAHYSIGSGTRVALEDAIALAAAVREHPRDVHAAVASFESARRPIADKLIAAADASAEWYEHYPEHMRQEPWELAWSYVQRSGRVDVERLRKIAPRFVAAHEERTRET